MGRTDFLAHVAVKMLVSAIALFFALSFAFALLHLAINNHLATEFYIKEEPTGALDDPPLSAFIHNFLVDSSHGSMPSSIALRQSIILLLGFLFLAQPKLRGPKTAKVAIGLILLCMSVYVFSAPVLRLNHSLADTAVGMNFGVLLFWPGVLIARSLTNRQHTSPHYFSALLLFGIFFFFESIFISESPTYWPFWVIIGSFVFLVAILNRNNERKRAQGLVEKRKGVSKKC